MKNSNPLRAVAVLGLVGCAAPALAQEHYTAGSVYTCDQYRVKEGKADAYARYLRSTVVPQSEAAKKAGLIVDRTYFLKADGPASTWNYMSCIAYKNFAALDYDAEREKKVDAIAAAQLKTADKAKQDETTKVRFDMRDYKGTTTLQEIFLKPLP